MFKSLFSAAAALIFVGCTQVRPMTTEEAEKSDTMSVATQSNADLNGNGKPDIEEAVVVAPGGIVMIDLRQTPDNANSAQVLDWRGYGFGDDDGWVKGQLSLLPVFDAYGNVVKFGNVFDDGIYRTACAEPSATDDPNSSDGWCDHMDGVDEASDLTAWIYQFSECGKEKSNLKFGFLNGKPYTLEGAGLGELNTDCG